MNFHSVNHKMWQRRNGTLRKATREYGLCTSLVTIYLITSPYANQSGVFYCPISHIASDTELSPVDVEDALSNLEKEGFCKYDYEEEVVWVINMVRYQVQNWPSNKNDNRFKGVMAALRSVPESYLIDEFLEMWHLEGFNPSKPPSVHGQTVGYLASPSVAPSEDSDFSDKSEDMA